MAFESFLNKYNIFIFAGNGGTGKTTLSAAWALEAVQAGKNVGLITIDPSRRLGEVFSMDIGKDDFKKIFFGEKYLDVHLVQSQKIINDFISKNFSSQRIIEFSQNRLFKQISTILAENQSISTVYYLAEMIQSEKYDLIIVDTPPSNHAVDFFSSPEGTLKIFKENIIAKALFESNSVKSWSSKKLFLSVLSFLVGKEFVAEMDSFFKTLFSFQQKIVKAAEVLQEKLKSPQVCYFLVSLPEIAKISEVTRVMQELKQQGITVEHLIVNRAYPEWMDISQSILPWSNTQTELKIYYDKLYNYYHNQKESVKAWLDQSQVRVRVYFVAEKNFFNKEFKMSEVQKTLIKALE